jgi:4'-phosphopantetheinyl transferase EntD
MLATDAPPGLARGLATIAPEDVEVGWRRITPNDLRTLWPVEAEHIARAVPLRQQEFATGRALLRGLIGRTVAIPVAPDRSPVLPPDVRASLAHDRELAVAALATAPGIRALGIDVEPATELEPDIARMVLRPDEPGLDAHQAFTLKEAAYKAWSTLGGRMLDHHDVRLTVRDETFTAEVVDDGSAFTGRWAHAGGRWLALVVVRDIQWRST